MRATVRASQADRFGAGLLSLYGARLNYSVCVAGGAFADISPQAYRILAGVWVERWHTEFSA